MLGGIVRRMFRLAETFLGKLTVSEGRKGVKIYENEQSVQQV